MLLKVEDIKVYYGGVEAVKGVSLELEEGDLIALLGPNGAGKSTILKTISGLMKSASGQILFRGKRIDGVPARTIVAQGISLIPEGRRIFPYMTVYENLKMGGYIQTDKAEFKKTLDLVYTLFPRLKERAKQVAGTFSGGEQQMLAIGRSLMSNPTVLLMDEPSIGLSPMMVTALAETIAELHRRGKSILLAEQNVVVALKLARWGYVMETGRIVLQGPAEALAKDKSIKEAYLGE